MNTKRNLIIRIINIFTLLAAVAWLTSTPSWEPLVTTLGLLVILIGSEFRDYEANKKRDVDSELFKNFLLALPSNGSVDFVSKYDFGGIFLHNKLEDLRIFLNEWNDPEHEFLNRKLENKKSNLYQSVEIFMGLIAENTFVIENGKQEVPREWEVTRPEEYRKILDEIHNQGDDVAQKHTDFVRYAKKILIV